MIHIVTALMAEAAPLIDFYGLKKNMDDHVFQIYRHNDIELAVCGTGKVRAAMAAAVLLERMASTRQDLLLNVGFCGSDCRDYEPGTLLAVWKVTDMDTGRDYYPDVFHGLAVPAVSLQCHADVVSRFTDPCTCRRETAERSNAWIGGGYVDMESAGIMEAAQMRLDAHQVVLLKIISDRLNPEEQGRDRQNKERLHDLMSGSLPWIIQVVAAWRGKSDHDQDSVLDAGHDACELDRLTACLRLTSAMRRLLTVDLHAARMRGTDPTPLLEAVTADQPLSKTESKKIWEQLRKDLQSSGQ